jgi:predicted phosphodiesterase
MDYEKIIADCGSIRAAERYLRSIGHQISERTLRRRLKSEKDYTSVCVIGDSHDSPHLKDKRRFTWIGRHINETKPDHVVQIGDLLTMDSCSRHEEWGTISGRKKPSFLADLESGEQALSLLDGELTYDPEKHVTLGNHEHRVKLWENAHPEVEDDFYCRVTGLMHDHDWSTVDYGDWVFIDGVGFTHAPFNTMGKPYGGKQPENQIANDAIHSIVFGHTHVANVKNAKKIGLNKKITILNVGSAMPDKHVEAYAKHNTTGWTYGVFDLILKDGEILDHSFMSMFKLQLKYG